MSWIKRNLYFLIASLVAVLLMGAAGWYLYTQLQTYSDNREKLAKDYTTLGELYKQNPHPGAEQVDNVTNAQGQARQWAALGEKARQQFKPIPPIPDSPTLTDENFSASLSRTISQLQREATNASVGLLTPGYAFSFEAQNRNMTFAAGSLAPLSVQLGEVKAICDVLFTAKINSLASIRRVRVSADDQAGNAGDYVTETIQTNDLGVVTPYNVVFHCFSQELAGVLSGFANSPFGLAVKTINIERGAPPVLDVPAPTVAQPVAPTMVNPAAAAAEQRRSEADARERIAARYGRYNQGGAARRPVPTPTPQPGIVAPAPAVKAGPQILLDEGQLKVEVVVEIIRPLEPKKPAVAPKKGK